MSIHEILSKDNTYHFIEQEHKGIKYMYASNIQEDNILAIVKYTMPLEIEKAFADTMSCWDSLYIWCGKSTSEWDKNPYFIIISLAKSKNYEWSHKEVLRICGTSISYILDTYFDIKNKTGYINKVKRGIFGGAFEPGIIRKEKN